MYEAAKKRKANVEALKLLTPDSAGPDEIEIDSLVIALREAEMVGTAMLHMPGNPKYGERAVKRATEKLMQAKKVRDAGGGGLARGSSRLGGPGDVPDAPDPAYKPNKAKTRDQMEGRTDESGKVNMDELGDGDQEEDFEAKMFAEEMAEAEAKGDGNLVKMIESASLKQLDSYKVDKKLVNEKGKISDPIRALYMICEAKGIVHSYHGATSVFSRRIVKWSHSVPFYRIMEFGWQPDVAHTDFAGILNANGLYSFTVGIPQFCFSIVFTISTAQKGRTSQPAPCETNPAQQCTLIEDFSRPTVQVVIVGFSMLIGTISLIISFTNILVDFPAQLFQIAEKDEESLHFTLQAEMATRTWEDKLGVEVSENVKKMLKLSTQFENNSIPGMEAPGLVIEDVMKLERRAMEKKIAYIEHFLTMSEDEKKVRNDLKKGKRKKKKGVDPEEDFIEEEQAGAVPQPLPAPVRSPSSLPPPRVPSQELPPPRAPSMASIPEPTPAAARAPSSARIPAASADAADGAADIPVDQDAPPA